MCLVYDIQQLVFIIQQLLCPVGWGSRIHRLHLCRRVRPLHDECPVYVTKQFDFEVSVIPELWGMQSTPPLPLLTSPLRFGVVAPDRVLSMGQKELNWCFHYFVPPLYILSFTMSVSHNICVTFIYFMKQHPGQINISSSRRSLR